MSNSTLWIFLIVSLMGNMVFGYMFWRLLQENSKLLDESARLLFENLKLKADIEIMRVDK